MTSRIVMRAATIISVPELALALSDITPEAKAKAGIGGLDLPTLTTAVADAARGQKILAELGYSGAYYVKTANGVEYVIIKGAPSLRPYLTGTRYLATNPKIVRVGLGPVSAASALKANFVLAMTMYTAADIAALIVGDGMTFSKLMGNFVFNAASTTVSGLASIATQAAIGYFTAMAAPAILGGIVVGVAVSVFMNDVAAEYKITEALTKLMDNVRDAYLQGDWAPNLGFHGDCAVPKDPTDLPDFEDCIQKQKPAKPGPPGPPGGGTGSGGGTGQGREGNSGTASGGPADDGDGPDAQDGGNPASGVDDSEHLDDDFGTTDPDFAGEGGHGGFCVGYTTADGDWVNQGCSDDYSDVAVPDDPQDGSH